MIYKYMIFVIGSIKKGVLVLSIMLFSLSAFCQKNDSTLVVNDKQENYDLWNNAATSYYVDSSALSSFEIIKIKKFTSSIGVSENFGFTNAAIWVKTHISFASEIHKSWLIGSSYNLIDTLEIYIFSESNKLIFHKLNGRLISHRYSEVDSHARVFPLNLDNSQSYTIYFRVAGRENKKVSLGISESHSFYSSYQKETWFWASYIGFYLAMILLQIIFLIITKKRISLYYLLYLSAFLMVEISRGNGMIGERYFWPDNTWLKSNALLLFVPISTVFGMLFYTNGLRLKKYSIIMFYILVIDMIIIICLAIYPLFINQHINVTNRVLISALISDLLVLVACIVALRNGNKVAIFYLIGTVFFFLGIVFTTLWHLGIVPNSRFMISSLNFGCLLEITFFTTAIAFDYRLTQKQTQEAQSLTIETLQNKNAEISTAMLQGQTIERKRVAADLHDNLGSTLSSIKWSLEAIDKSKMDKSELEVHQNLSAMLQSAYNEVRLLSHNLLPEEFEKQGLAAALEYFVRRINQQKKIKFSLDIAENVGRLDKKVEFELYSICLELANNIIKHSKATEAKIALFKTEGPLKLVVSDNGIGTFKNDSDGKGLKNVQARVDSLGGKWEIQNIHNQGVKNEITVLV